MTLVTYRHRFLRVAQAGLLILAVSANNGSAVAAPIEDQVAWHQLAVHSKAPMRDCSVSTKLPLRSGDDSAGVAELFDCKYDGIGTFFGYVRIHKPGDATRYLVDESGEGPPVVSLFHLMQLGQLGRSLLVFVLSETGAGRGCCTTRWCVVDLDSKKPAACVPVVGVERAAAKLIHRADHEWLSTQEQPG